VHHVDPVASNSEVELTSGTGGTYLAAPYPRPGRPGAHPGSRRPGRARGASPEPTGAAPVNRPRQGA